MFLRQVLLLSALIGHQAVGAAQDRFPTKVEADLDEAFTKMFETPHVVNAVACHSQLRTSHYRRVAGDG